MKTAIVILNWNGQALLAQFLPTLVACTPKDLAEIHVVDNGSTDQSIDWMQANYPEVKLICLTENNGFAGGYNQGLKQVEADLYCLLNSDVAVSSDWLVPVLTHFKNHPETAIAQPKILDYLNPHLFEYAGGAGGFIDALGFPYCRGRIFQTIEQDRGQYNDDCHVFWATGACFFIRSSVYHQLGGFDEFYFAHQEEVDLCWRAQKHGYRVMALGGTQVYHLGGSTLSNMNPKKTFLNFRNSLYSLVKNHKPARALLSVLIRLPLDGIAGLLFLFQGKPAHTQAVFWAHMSFYRHLPSICAKRKFSGSYVLNFSQLSIVFSYFIRGKKIFSELRKD